MLKRTELSHLRSIQALKVLVQSVGAAAEGQMLGRSGGADALASGAPSSLSQPVRSPLEQEQQLLK
jgi:hypothetical protein